MPINPLLLLEASPPMLVGCTFVLGLLVGSFLNVVIYRLPRRLEQDWKRECSALLHPDTEPTADEPVISLVRPGSRCPHCKTAVKPYHNVPVISYLLLRGRCANCGVGISPLYPLVELLTGLASAYIAWHFGYGLTTVAALVLSWALIALTFIDLRHQILPDAITLPLLWLGLLLSLFGIFTDPRSSIIGACVGYLSLWSVYHLFRLITGKEGMGYGDFKLLALFGAWLGWQMLPSIILLASFTGAVIGIAMILLRRTERGIPIAFGPYLAAAGWLALLVGDRINTSYLHLVGF